MTIDKNLYISAQNKYFHVFYHNFLLVYSLLVLYLYLIYFTKNTSLPGYVDNQILR